MMCDLPEHGKIQANHPDPVRPPLMYMHVCKVFDSTQADLYDLCRFYIIGTTDDPLHFPSPWEPVTHGQVWDLLKSVWTIGQPYLVLAHSTDSVTVVSLLRELHTTACLHQPPIDQCGKLVKLSFCTFCAYAMRTNLSYVNHIIITIYNVSYGCGKCLKQVFVSSTMIHNHKKVCLGLATKKSAWGSGGRGGDTSH